MKVKKIEESDGVAYGMGMSSVIKRMSVQSPVKELPEGCCSA